MKPLYVLFVGVAVGWAASSVDWSREAVGQDVDTITGKKVLQYDGPAPLAVGRKIVLQEVTDEKGVKHVVPHEAVDSPICQPGRYQISAYAVESRSGAYVIDSVTGKVWRVREALKPELVSDHLPQQ